MTTLAIVVGLILVACLFLVCIGCRAILTLCGQLEHDRRNEYRLPESRAEKQARQEGATR